MALWIFGDIIGWIYFKIAILVCWIYYYIYRLIELILRVLAKIPILGPLFDLIADFWSVQEDIILYGIDKLDDYADQWLDSWCEW